MEIHVLVCCSLHQELSSYMHEFDVSRNILFCAAANAYDLICQHRSGASTTSTISLISKVVQSHELFSTSPLFWFYWCKACANMHCFLLNSRLNICMLGFPFGLANCKYVSWLVLFFISIYCQVLPIYKAWSMVLATGTLWKRSDYNWDLICADSAKNVADGSGDSYFP
jgi:hypothetical protein